jgi:hypothetical protein
MKKFLDNIMNHQKYTLYSALHPSIEKTVSLKDRIRYLKCKFWKSSKEDAEFFFNIYLGPVAHELHRPVGIITGQLLRKNNGDDVYGKIRKSVDLYRLNPKDKYFERYFKHKLILDAICGPAVANYPKVNLTDDVLNWAFQNQLISNSDFCLVQKNISIARMKPFKNKDIPAELCLEIVHIFLDKNRYIYLEDIADLLFCNSELMLKINTAVKSGEIIAISSKDASINYVDMRSLLKWLLLNNLAHELLVQEFLYLKIEAIKENRVDYNGTFQSLSKLVKLGNDRNDLLSDALNNNILVYLKYPRDYLHWRELIFTTTCNTDKKYAEHRYNGLGQLKIRTNEDSHCCHFGGLTVDMLFYGERPTHGLSKSIPNVEYEIEFVCTEDESNIGLQPYIKIPKNEISQILSDDNLIVVSLIEHKKTANQVDTQLQKNVTSKVTTGEIINPEIAKKLSADDKKTIWSEVFAQLHQMSVSIQKGNKMEVADTAISLILNAIKKIHSDFDPMSMPGTVEDFHRFCLDIPCGDKIFPSNKNSFGKYCRRSLKKSELKLPPHCAWENPSKPNKQFWDLLKTKDVPYTVNRMTFA